MTTGIVILNYNNAKDTINCIESVIKYNTAKIKLVVVDNGSTNREMVENISIYLTDNFPDGVQIIHDDDKTIATLPFITFLISRDNAGYAEGNNKGLKLLYSDDEIEKIMILNNDILFIEDIIPRLNHYLDTLYNAAIVSPLLLKKDQQSIDYNCARRNVSLYDLTKKFLGYAIGISIPNKSRKIFTEDPTLLNKEWVEIELPSGSCMFLDKKYFQGIGGFDPNTFLYYEENILYKKVAKTGRKNYICPQLRCIHIGASTTSKVVRSYPFIARSEKSVSYYVDNYSNGGKLSKAFFHFAHCLYLLRTYLAWNIKHHRRT